MSSTRRRLVDVIKYAPHIGLARNSDLVATELCIHKLVHGAEINHDTRQI